MLSKFIPTSPTLEAFMSLLYECPKCETTGVVQLHSPLIYKGFRCRGCKFVWTCNSLFEHYCMIYGFPPPQEKVYVGVTEYTCDNCGASNILIPRLEAEVKGAIRDLDGDEIGGYFLGKVKRPYFGCCEQCHAGYNLVYPSQMSFSPNE